MVDTGRKPSFLYILMCSQLKQNTDCTMFTRK